MSQARPQKCRVCDLVFGDRVAGRVPKLFHYGRGLCQYCHGRALRRGTLDRWPGTSLRRNVPDAIEDIAFLAFNGEPASTWAERVGYQNQADSLRRLLYRHGRADLARALQPYT